MWRFLLIRGYKSTLDPKTKISFSDFSRVIMLCIYYVKRVEEGAWQHLNRKKPGSAKS